MTVVESVMNLAVAGAEPKAMVNCLNFGNPEHPEVMWQLTDEKQATTVHQNRGRGRAVQRVDHAE